MKISKAKLRQIIKEELGALREAEGETPQDVAARINKIPGSTSWRHRSSSTRGNAIADWRAAQRGDVDKLAPYYPHVQDLVAFATEVLELLDARDKV